MDRGRRAQPGPLADGRAAVGLGTARPRTRWPASGRPTRPTTTSSIPITSARAAGRCASRRPTPGTASAAPRSARSRAGSGSTGTSPTPPPGRSLRPRGWAGEGAWSPAIRRRASRLPRDRSPVRRDLVREDGDLGPRLGRAARAPVRQPRRPRRRANHLHADAQPPWRHLRCSFTVSRLGEERFSIVTGTAFGNHDRKWIRHNIAAEAPEGSAVQVTDVTAQWACFGVWGPRAREILQPLTRASLANADFPTSRCASSPSATSRSWRCG